MHRVSGQLRPVSSSRRYKTDIDYVDVTDAERAAILGLRLVTYADKCIVEEMGNDPSRAPHYWGVIAEDIIDGPLDRLVVRGDSGLPESFMYERLAALLVPVVREIDRRLTALETTAA